MIAYYGLVAYRVRYKRSMSFKHNWLNYRRAEARRLYENMHWFMEKKS